MSLSRPTPTAGLLSNVQRWRRVSRQCVKYLAQWKTAKCNFHHTVFHENSLEVSLTLKLEILTERTVTTLIPQPQNVSPRQQTVSSKNKATVTFTAVRTLILPI